MTPTGQTLCLCMIVKNEAHVIRRCLASVRPIIDHWIVVDTGSTDGTQDVVREAMAGLPGKIVERPWVDFAHNRTEALELARPHGTYALIIDADDALDLKPGFTLPDLDADSYTIDIFDNGTTYRRTQVVRNTLAWRYRGVLHEFLECPEAKTIDHLPILMRRVREGARSTDPQTYAKDAAILERALAEETDPFLISRYTFYLAQSYRDCGNHEAALKHYLRRVELGFWIEEVYVSLFQAGRMMEALGRDPDLTIATYERASATVPTRAEAAHASSKLCRLLGRNAQGYAIAKPFAGLPPPQHGLFVQNWVYEYALFDELAVNAYWCGEFRVCLDASLRAVQSGKVPPSEMQRFLNNMRFSLDKLETAKHMAASANSKDAVHTLMEPRNLHQSLPSRVPRILLAVLAKQKEFVLPLYLKCIESLDYPKSSIVLYVRTNNNTDRTAEILENWLSRVQEQYAAVEYCSDNVSSRIENFGSHEWNPTRFRILADIRQTSLEKAKQQGCNYYFTADCDNFVRPCTLKSLVASNLPIVAPLLRYVDPSRMYSNYHAAIDANGYYKSSDTYEAVLFRHVIGLFELPVVHCTYLLRSDVIPLLGYSDGTDAHEYVIFSRKARNANIPQYFDNRQLYGYITLDDQNEILISDQLKRLHTLLGFKPN